MKTEDIIYTVELHDYDSDEVIGYFTDEETAQTCCDYFNLVKPSDYPEHFNWEVKHLRKNNMDYETLLNSELKRRVEEKQKMIDEVEAKEFELYKQLRLKYEGRLINEQRENL